MTILQLSMLGLIVICLVCVVFFGVFVSLQRNTIKNLNQTITEKNQQIGELTANAERINQDLHQLQVSNVSLETALEHEKRSFQEKLNVMKQSEEMLREAFKSLSSDSLRSNSESFLQLAESVLEKFESRANQRLAGKEQAIQSLVGPIQKSLESFQLHVNEIEKKRVGAYEGIAQQVKGLMAAQQDLQQETASLASALKSPTARGKWGELQLRRVVELSGMLSHCDFFEQNALEDRQSGAVLRPDMVVRLPGNQSIVIDAKAPLKAYFEALESQNEKERMVLLKEHAILLRKQIQSLSQKSYWNQLDGSPEFVLLFLPGESYFSAALQADPSLIELGVDNKVLLVTPTSLIALLRTAALAWRQESINDNARAINNLGRELYQRMADLSTHLSDVGRHLRSTVSSYNRAVGTVESRLFVSARRFKELHADDPKKEVKSLEPLDLVPREHETSRT